MKIISNSNLIKLYWNAAMLIIYALFMAAFVWQWQSWVVMEITSDILIDSHHCSVHYESQWQLKLDSIWSTMHITLPWLLHYFFHYYCICQKKKQDKWTSSVMLWRHNGVWIILLYNYMANNFVYYAVTLQLY